MALDRDDIEAVAVRVVELLERHEVPSSPRLVDAAELARRFGMERSWVYSHAAELGAGPVGKRTKRSTSLRSESCRESSEASWQVGAEVVTEAFCELAQTFSQQGRAVAN